MKTEKSSSGTAESPHLMGMDPLIRARIFTGRICLMHTATSSINETRGQPGRSSIQTRFHRVLRIPSAIALKSHPIVVKS